MSSSTRISRRSKPKNKGRIGHTTDKMAEHRIDNNIRLATLHVQLTIKMNALRFQILKMAKAEVVDDSLSLLESPVNTPAMSQEVNEEGLVVFKCTTCNASYKQLKRLQTHLKSKHNMAIELDDTVMPNSPLMTSTREDAVPNGSPNRIKKDSEPTKSSTRKRNRVSSDEEEDDATISERSDGKTGNGKPKPKRTKDVVFSDEEEDSPFGISGKG